MHSSEPRVLFQTFLDKITNNTEHVSHPDLSIVFSEDILQQIDTNKLYSLDFDKSEYQYARIQM